VQDNTPDRPIFLSGRVMLDDGTPPPNRVAIQRLCGSNPRTEGYTDSRGYFSIQIGSPSPEVFQDASNGGVFDRSSNFPGSNSGRGGMPSMGGGNERQLMNCELRAQLAGYESQTVNLSMRRQLDNPDVGTILLHRLGQSSETTISATTLAAPKDARKAYEKGLEAARKSKFDEAQANLEKAVSLYPRYAAAWADLGRVQASQGQMEGARTSFDKAVAADPKYVVPYIEIAKMGFRAQQWQEVADTTERATGLDPFHFPQAFFMNAVANYNLQRRDRAEESVRRALQLDTQHQIPQASHLLGVILAQKQDFSGAAAFMRDYLKFAPQASDVADVRSQLAHLEELAKANPAAPAQ
jgi:tetratricopeptide (TPR) repeat protein